MRKSKKLTIMAFGDSLTVGYQSPTAENELPAATPYTDFLRQRTDRMLADRSIVGPEVEFLNRGVVGELTGDMIDRFDKDVVNVRPDMVIILGGSNDLGWGFEPSLVADNLARMYDEALGHEVEPVACSVPSVLGFDEDIGPRVELNQLIKECSSERGIVYVDLFTATSEHSSGRLKKAYSNDGLHLSSKGYEAMAETIFSDALREKILVFVKSSVT